MPPSHPTLSFDLGSPYAYLAVERAESVLGSMPQLQPVLLGAIFRRRGSGSWAQTAQRDRRIAELQARAQRYGLPRFVWPAGWPVDGLAAMRQATQRAWDGGVRGVPTVLIGDRAFYGDDHLEAAAGALAPG